MKFPKYKIKTTTRHDGRCYYTAHVRRPFELVDIGTWFDSFHEAWNHLDESGDEYYNIESHFETEAEAIKAIEQHKERLTLEHSRAVSKVTEKIYN
jgi:hypothetical protein